MLRAVSTTQMFNQFVEEATYACAGAARLHELDFFDRFRTHSPIATCYPSLVLDHVLIPGVVDALIMRTR